MRQFKVFTILALAAMVLASCSKVEKILPKKEGTWNISTETYREFVSNTLDTTYSAANSGVVFFGDDGKGTMTETGSTTADPFTWSVSDDQEIVTICVDVSGLALCIPYDVIESDKDQQKWMATIQSGTAGTYDEIEWVLDRKE